MSACRHDPQKEWPQPSTRGRRSAEIGWPSAAVANGTMQREQLCASGGSAGGGDDADAAGRDMAAGHRRRGVGQWRWRWLSQPTAAAVVGGAFFTKGTKTKNSAARASITRITIQLHKRFYSFDQLCGPAAIVLLLEN